MYNLTSCNRERGAGEKDEEKENEAEADGDQEEENEAEVDGDQEENKAEEGSEHKEDETGGDDGYNNPDDDDADTDISPEEFKQRVADKVESLLDEGCFMRNGMDSQVCHIRFGCSR